MTFELRKAVTDMLDTTAATDFRLMAADVAKAVPAKHVREALTEALVGYIATLNQQRRATNPMLTGASPSPNRSTKVAGIAAMHQRMLRDLVHVGQSVNKRLGDCTYEDLMFAAAERREHAARNAAKAEQYERLAEKLQRFNVVTVAALPEAELDVLGAAA